MRIAILTIDDRQTYRDYSSPEPRYEKAQQALLEGFAHFPEIEVHVISCLQRPVPTPRRIAGNITAHSLHVPKIGWLRTLYQGCIRATRRKLQELKPDIVHAQGTERDCALDAVFSGFPNVVTIHGNMKAIAQVQKARVGGYYWLAARLETPALRRTLGVFCNSAYTESLVAPRARRTWRVPNAIRSAFFDKPPAAQPGPVLLNVGLLDVRKRQTEILAVVRRLRQRGIRVEIEFAGVIPDTSYAREFRRQLAEAESTGYARHVGVLGLDDLIKRLDASSGMVHFPSEESFGLVVAEALARNRKMFASSVGGIVEITDGAELAETFAPEDWSGLENAIAAWIEAGHTTPTRAAALMRERYEPKRIAQQHVGIYERLKAEG